MIALILGGAACVYEDVEAALDLGEFDGVIAAKRVARRWPGRIDAWVSLHAGEKQNLIARRERYGLPPIGKLFEVGDVPHLYLGQTNPGASGLFAVKVALDELGYGRAVLCGVPMSPTPHFDVPVAWSAADYYQTGWRQALPHIADHVRSMSGWTEQLLGRPDAAWIAGACQ